MVSFDDLRKNQDAFDNQKERIAELTAALERGIELMSAICEALCPGNPPPHGVEILAQMRAAVDRAKGETYIEQNYDAARIAELTAERRMLTKRDLIVCRRRHQLTAELVPLRESAEKLATENIGLHESIRQIRQELDEAIEENAALKTDLAARIASGCVVRVRELEENNEALG